MGGGGGKKEIENNFVSLILFLIPLGGFPSIHFVSAQSSYFDYSTQLR